MASVPTPPDRDPRVEADSRPAVVRSSSGAPTWLIVAGFVGLGLILFAVLDARRRAAEAPTVRPRADEDALVARQAPPLFIPSAPVPLPLPVPTPSPAATPTFKAPVFIPPPRIIYVPQPAPPAASPPAAPRGPTGATLVFDNGTGTAAPVNASEGTAGTPEAPVSAGARASMIRHRPTIVAQGTLISAVLESALDSTRAGPVRALVSRDVRGFDGSLVLVPRGSRLFGDYRADLQPGQNRALITWTRLIRPDGASIALGSPASDPLGRAGIRGKVNSHFLERFAAAILQSSLDIGVNYASRLGTNNSAVVVALPGATQAIAQPLTGGGQIQPTLRVRQGTAIAVFVARDLDFTAVSSEK